MIILVSILTTGIACLNLGFLMGRIFERYDYHRMRRAEKEAEKGGGPPLF